MLTSTTLLEGLHDPRNERAWQRFFARYRPMPLSYGRRSGLSEGDAEDLVAERFSTFVRAYQAGRYERGRMRGWSRNFASWRRRDGRRLRGRHPGKGS